MSATYPAVYALLRERMADEFDIPTDAEIIAAALDVAKAAVKAGCPEDDCYDADDSGEPCIHDVAIAEIDALREVSE